MVRNEIQLGDAQVIKDLLARYANHNSRIIPLETLYAAILARLDALEDLIEAGGTPNPTPTPGMGVSLIWSTMQ